MPLAVGSIFQATYEIVAPLGGGSYGEVYRARRVATGQQVALKLWHPPPGAATAELGDVRESFRREMRLLAELWHPHIVRVLEWGEPSVDVRYAVFDLVPGVTLRALLQAENRLSMAETIHVMGQVLDALSCAHAHGIVHRDLKPENIMVTNTGVRRNAVVLDFGVAALSGARQRPDLPPPNPGRELVGSPGYAAPEQLRQEQPSPASDLYSWGLIFIECVTGEPAVRGATTADVVMKQLSDEPILLPPWLMQHRLGRSVRAVTTKPVARRTLTASMLMHELAAAGSAGGDPASRRHGLAPADSERRELTVVSCRFVPPSGAGPVDAEEIDLRLHELQSRCADLALRHGGELAGVMADRVMMTFGYPHAREGDARRALAMALEIGDLVATDETNGGRVCWAARIGVHSGAVIVRARRPSGRHAPPHPLGVTAQIAAAIESMAVDGEILLSRDSLRGLRGRVDVESAGELPAPPDASPMPIYRLRAEEGRARWAIGEGSGESPLVGRERQLEELFAAWADAAAGRPAAICITGEPGIGKSRVVRELHRHSAAGRWFEGRCVQEHQDSPLAPLIDLLNSMEEPLEAVLERYGFAVAETMPLLSPLLAHSERGYQPLALSAQRQKEETLAALLELLLRIAAREPTVFVLEDLHWADPTTIEFIVLLLREVRSARATAAPAVKLCVVLTARPHVKFPWPADDLTMVSLTRLSERDVAAMIGAAFAGGDPVPPALLAEIVRRAEGIPLFVEEVARVLAESGPSALDAPAASSAPTIPGALQAPLMARLDGLSPAARDSAQLASVLGREFRYDLLQAVSPVDADELRENLSELQTAGLLFPRRGARHETYGFRHVLLRDAAYASLVRAVRQPLHLRVARTLCERFPDVVQHRPETVAHHFEHGGEAGAAIEYWHRAGSRALHRAAYAEACALLRRGLAVIADDVALERRRQKVQLLSTLGTVLISTNGYSSAEVERTFADAWELCGDVGGEIPNDVVYGFWGVHITRSSRKETAALIPRLHQIAERAADPVGVLIASACLGTVHYWQAEYEASERYLSRGRRLFDTPEFQDHAQTFGYGVGLYSHAYGQLTAWMRGHPDQADAVRQELLLLSQRTRDPYCAAIALAFAVTLAHDRDRPDVELDFANQLITLTDEQRLPVWHAIGLIARGGAYARMGGAGGAEALGPLRAGLQTLQAVGVLCSYSYFLSYLAEAHLVAGDYDAALATLDESAGLCRTLVARPHEPELYRLYGETRLRRDGPAGAAAAAEWYQRALQLARASHAKSYELRIATSLARLWRDQGRVAEARTLLDDIVGWFTEGTGTHDLLAAADVRATLG